MKLILRILAGIVTAPLWLPVLTVMAFLGCINYAFSGEWEL
jgi:hypothetical protein